MTFHKFGINRRTHIALLAHQTPAQGWIEQAHTAITGCIPKTPVCAFVSPRNKRYLQRKHFPNKRMKKTSETVVRSDKNYEEFSQKPHVPEEIYLELKDNFLNSLKVQWSSDLEKETRGQPLSEKWHHERSKQISSSFFKDVEDRHPTTSCVNLVQRNIYKSHFKTPATKYGIANEIIAINNMWKTLEIVSDNVVCLLTSPDSLIAEDGLTEVKCPYRARNVTSFLEIGKIIMSE